MRQGEEFQVRQTGKIARGLATMERDLGAGEFCHGGAFTLADIACGVALGYLDQVRATLDWRKDHPCLARLAERLAARDSFAKTKGDPL